MKKKRSRFKRIRNLRRNNSREMQKSSRRKLRQTNNISCIWLNKISSNSNSSSSSKIRLRIVEEMFHLKEWLHLLPLLLCLWEAVKYLLPLLECLQWLSI
jgi:hypothetical protein